MGEPKLELTDNMVHQPGKELLFAHLRFFCEPKNEVLLKLIPLRLGLIEPN